MESSCLACQWPSPPTREFKPLVEAHVPKSWSLHQFKMRGQPGKTQCWSVSSGSSEYANLSCNR
eukprot:61538-Amphidinium_carterae.1